MSTEQRIEGSRDRCHIAAAIAVSADSARTPCVVENISENGARLRFSTGVEVPDSFSLFMPVLDNLYEEKASELRWRVGNAVGIRFSHPTGNVTKPDK